MRRIIPGLLVLMCVSIFSTAQTSVKDTEAKSILDKVSKKFKSFKAVQAVFHLKVEDASGKVQGNRQGTVFMKGNKYKVQMAEQEIFSDGTTIWTYDKGANEVTVATIDPTANSITPQKIFTNFYDKDFLYKLNGEKKTNRKVIQEIELTPVDKSKAFHKVYVYVDKAAQNISSTKILEKNGNRYTYTVDSFKSDPPLSDAIFVFNKNNYPGVEVVDLR
jgi:outer membrane lipoprotein carrier protein